MLHRIIPSGNESIPVIGVGTWKQFDIDSASPERENLKKVLQSMHDHGARLIDSSPMYARSEQVVGELTHEINLADYFFYATKIWTTGKEQGIHQLQDSFRKMKRKKMDLLQIHNMVDWQTHFETLQEWKHGGRIRYIGITHYTVSSHNQLEQIIKTKPFDFVQFNYSIGIRDAEKTLLPTAMDKGVSVIINEPLEKGNLFGHVRNKPLPAWAIEYDIKTWGQFFLKYVIAHPAVTCIIPGTSDPAHIKDNIAAAQGIIPDEKGRKKMSDYFDTL